MKTIAAEFPVPLDFTPDAFCERIRAWVLGSRYNDFDPTTLPPIELTPDKQHFTDGNDELEILYVQEGVRDMVAGQFVHRVEGLNWVTDAIYSRNSKDCWCSVRLSVTADSAGTNLPEPKVPLLAKQILEVAGGAPDGNVPVKPTPHMLDDTEADWVADLMEGRPKRHLPVIFISAFGGKPLRIDADLVAARLAGMAHVLIEPHRGFSFLLKDNVSVPNAFAGTMGIYWPDTRFVDLIHPEDRFENHQIEMQERLLAKVTEVMGGKKPMPRLTRDAVMNAFNRQQQATARAEGEAVAEKNLKEIDEEADELVAELNEADTRIAELEAKVEALNAQLGEQAAKASTKGKLVLSTGTEAEFYDAEIRDFVLDAIEHALERFVGPKGRRRDVLEAIIAANPKGGEAEQRVETLKQLFKGFTALDRASRKQLEVYGFDITDDGKHYKATWLGDDRYVVAMPKSGSDARAGANLTSQFSNWFF